MGRRDRPSELGSRDANCSRGSLEPGGDSDHDVFVDASRTRPASGALFAVNMLVNTPGGGTFTFGEMRDDLTSVGFSKSKSCVW